MGIILNLIDFILKNHLSFLLNLFEAYICLLNLLILYTGNMLKGFSHKHAFKHCNVKIRVLLFTIFRVIIQGTIIYKNLVSKVITMFAYLSILNQSYLKSNKKILTEAGVVLENNKQTNTCATPNHSQRCRSIR